VRGDRSWLAGPLGARLVGGLIAAAGLALLVAGLLALSGGDGDGTPPGAAPGSPSAGAPSPTASRPSSPARPTATRSVTPTPPAGTTASPRPVPLRPPLTVLNNSTIRGLGERVAAEAERRGWRVAQVGNFAGRLPVTTVYYTPGNAAEERAARELANQFPQIEQVLPRYEGLPPTPAGIVLVVTRDWS
jgi:LytR cell envelope-related transcriptional attenuator